MSQAYTPGLIISEWNCIQKERRLPTQGEVLVKKGDHVEASTIVALAQLQGLLQTVKISDKLNIEPEEVPALLLKHVGEKVNKGDKLAEKKGLFGWLKDEALSDFEGIIESISPLTGHLFIREAPIPLEVKSYVSGTITDVFPGEGVIVETEGALIQGVFGIGGEKHGEIKVATPSIQQNLTPALITKQDQGKIIVGGNTLCSETIQKARLYGISGIVIGSIKNQTLKELTEKEIGVAVTGKENLPFSLIITEGFGSLSMAKQTFELFQSLENHYASMNGATQIRAGVIRPEVIVPLKKNLQKSILHCKDFTLREGAMVRIIREPYFGKIGTIINLPSELMELESGIKARVLEAKLESGQNVFVPRTNVELLEN